MTLQPGNKTKGHITRETQLQQHHRNNTAAAAAAPAAAATVAARRPTPSFVTAAAAAADDAAFCLLRVLKTKTTRILFPATSCLTYMLWATASTTGMLLRRICNFGTPSRDQ